MNQGIAFARTIRALEADDFRASKVGLFVAAVLLGAWAWWMFTARVAQYETTTNVRIESGRAIAYFTPEAISRVRAGQPAILHFDGNTFVARVQTVASDHAALAFGSQPPIPNPQSPGANATAEVEVSRVSPASIAFQTLGQRHR